MVAAAVHELLDRAEWLAAGRSSATHRSNRRCAPSCCSEGHENTQHEEQDRVASPSRPLLAFIKGDGRFFIFNLKIAEIFLCLRHQWMIQCFQQRSYKTLRQLMTFLLWSFHGYVTVIGFLFYLIRQKYFVTISWKHISVRITCIPDLISKATDDSKAYFLEAFTDAFRDSNVEAS